MEQAKMYMRECLDLAEQALAAGNPPVGALIVHEGKVIARGIESGCSSGDITNHAEILAVRNAVANGHADQLAHSQMYTTHEPCIMCSYLIRHHRIPLIVYGTAVPFVGGCTSELAVLRTESVPKWGAAPQVIGGICGLACDEIMQRFAASLKQVS